MRIKDKRRAKGYSVMTKGASTGENVVRSELIKAQAFDDVPNHPFIELMNDPNPLDTEKSLKEAYMGYLLLTGNAYMYGAVPGVGLNATKPRELWVIPSPAVEIVGGDNMNPVRGYKVNYYGNDVIPEAQIAHMKYFNPQSYWNDNQFLYGMSPLRAARGVISQYESGEVAQGTLFRNMSPAGIMSGEDEAVFSDEQYSAIQDSFNQRHMGEFNGGGIVVTPAKLKWNAIGLSPVDLKLIEADDNWLQKLAAIYHYPKELITGSENVASSGTADKQLVTKPVMGLLRRFDDTMTKWIREMYRDESLVYVSDTSYYPELQDDRAKQAEWLKETWVLTPNEWRNYIDHDNMDDPNMDRVYIPSGKKLLGDVADPMGIDTDILDRNNLNDYEGEN